MELREEIGAIVREACEIKGRQFAYDEFADRILSLPRIKSALEELAVKQRIEAHFADTRDERPFVDGKRMNLGHSISTGTRSD